MWCPVGCLERTGQAHESLFFVEKGMTSTFILSNTNNREDKSK